jgi:hypothetical protein
MPFISIRCTNVQKEALQAQVEAYNEKMKTVYRALYNENDSEERDKAWREYCATSSFSRFILYAAEKYMQSKMEVKKGVSHKTAAAKLSHKHKSRPERSFV